jgi:hypothetical protein
MAMAEHCLPLPCLSVVGTLFHSSISNFDFVVVGNWNVHVIHLKFIWYIYSRVRDSDVVFTNNVCKHPIAVICHLFHIIYFHLCCNLLLVTFLLHNMLRPYMAIIRCLLSRQNCCNLKHVKMSYRVSTRYFLTRINSS